MISVMCRVLKIIQINLFTKQKQIYLQTRNRLTDIENKLMVTRGEKGGG